MIYRKALIYLWALFIASGIFFGFAQDLQAEAVGPTFIIQYYADNALENSLGDNPRLRIGTYYLKITSNEVLTQYPTISIDSEGAANDVTNAATVLVEGNVYRYTRIIVSNSSSGDVLENISITGMGIGGNTSVNADPLDEVSKAAYTDTLYPNVVQVSITSSNSNHSVAKAGDTVNLSFICSEAVKVPVVSLARHNVVSTSLNNVSWVADYTMTSQDSDGLIEISISATDLAGNTRAPITSATTDLTSVRFDTTPMTLQFNAQNKTIRSSEIGQVYTVTVGVYSLEQLRELQVGDNYTITEIGTANSDVNLVMPTTAGEYNLYGVDFAGNLVGPLQAKIIIPKFTINATFSIGGIEVNNLQPNQDIVTTAEATNNQETSQQVLLIIALYDSQNRIKNISYAANNIMQGSTQNLSASSRLPETVIGCKVKVFIWEGGDIRTSSLIPLSNVSVITETT